MTSQIDMAGGVHRNVITVINVAAAKTRQELEGRNLGA